MNASEESNGPDQAVVQVGSTEVVVTLDDAKAIRDALLDYLRRSDYYARDRLVGWTDGGARIDPAGKVRLGPWVLGSDGSRLVLRYREPPGPEAGKAHRASVEKDGEAWVITGLVMERIRQRPPR